MEEKSDGIKQNLATLPAKLKQYVEVKRHSCRVLDEHHEEFPVVRQIHLQISLKHEPEATRKAKLSPVGPVMREGVEYEETYLIQRLRPQKCTECGKVCKHLGRLNSHLQRHTTEKPYK